VTGLIWALTWCETFLPPGITLQTSDGSPPCRWFGCVMDHRHLTCGHRAGKEAPPRQSRYIRRLGRRFGGQSHEHLIDEVQQGFYTVKMCGLPRDHMNSSSYHAASSHICFHVKLHDKGPIRRQRSVMLRYFLHVIPRSSLVRCLGA
jgi:hypothetical protein